MDTAGTRAGGGFRAIVVWVSGVHVLLRLLLLAGLDILLLLSGLDVLLLLSGLDVLLLHAGGGVSWLHAGLGVLLLHAGLDVLLLHAGLGVLLLLAGLGVYRLLDISLGDNNARNTLNQECSCPVRCLFCGFVILLHDAVEVEADATVD